MKIIDIFSNFSNTKKFIEVCANKTVSFYGLRQSKVISFKQYLLETFSNGDIGFNASIFADTIDADEIKTLEAYRIQNKQETYNLLNKSVQVNTEVQKIFNLIDSILVSDYIDVYKTSLFPTYSKIGIQLPFVSMMFGEYNWSIFVQKDGGSIQYIDDYYSMDINLSESTLDKILLTCSQVEDRMNEFPPVFEVISSMLEYSPSQLRIKQTSPLTTEYKIVSPDGDRFMFSLDQNFKPAYIDDIEVERVPNLDWSRWLDELAKHIYNKS